MKSALEALFLRGDFKKITDNHDTGKRPAPVELGALVFTGFAEDAELHFEKWNAEMSADEKAVSLFFLAIGRVRSSEFALGQKHLISCFRLRHELKHRRSKIFLYQGLGFFRHFACRYRNSAYWAQKAWRLSLLEDSALGKTLSCDLLAQALLQKGELARGFAVLEKASKLAQAAGQSGFAAGLEVSKLCYQAQFGLRPKTIVTALEKKLSTLKAKDTYSRANLGLELARQLTLRGRVSESSQLLETLQSEVFKSGHARQQSTWHFRLAYNEFLSGNSEGAAKQTERALAVLKPHDLAHRLQALGLKQRICAKGSLNEEIEYLTRRVGTTTALNHLRSQAQRVTHGSEDLLGILVNEAKQSSSPQGLSTLETTYKICEQGYYQLLRYSFFQAQPQYLLMDILPGALLILDRGNIQIFTEVLTPLLKRILLFLKTGAKDKKDFIENMWGYRYDSLRHDALVYAALTRLRKCMGSAGEWIEFRQEKYRLNPKVGVGVFEHHTILPVQAFEETVESKHPLNYRQTRLLRVIRDKKDLSIRDCMGILKATKITANRDVRLLLEAGYIRQSGRGKATRYS